MWARRRPRTAISAFPILRRHIEKLTPDQIAAMYSHGVYSITATDASLQFTAAQIEAIEGLARC